MFFLIFFCSFVEKDNTFAPSYFINIVSKL